MERSNNKFNLLTDAYKAIGSRQYSQAAVILEIAARMDWADPYPLFMLAVAYLYSDRFDRADAVLKQLGLKYPSYLPYLQLQAFLRFKSATAAEDAITVYIELADSSQGDMIAARGLRGIRNARDFSKFQKKAKMSDFVAIKPPPKYLKKRVLTKTDGKGGVKERFVSAEEAKKERRAGLSVIGFKISILIYSLIVIGGISVIFYNLNFAERFFRNGPAEDKKNDRVDLVELGGSGYDLLQTLSAKKTPEFYHSTKKIIDDFKTAKMLIKQEKYNEALYILNAMNNSNASFRVKEKVDFLVKYIMNADPRKYEYLPVDYIAKKPYLYQGCSIKWTGRVANLKKKENSLEFSLLVDYKDRDRFAGIADVFSNRVDYKIQNGDMIEMEGIFISVLGSGSRIQINSKNIKKI